MPGHWLKPFGTSVPRRPMADCWTERFELDPFPLMTGPADRPPQMAAGDRVLFHAVGHVRLFAAAVIVGDPQFEPEGRWAPRWPWLYQCRVEVWVPRITAGPRTSAVAPRRAIGAIQHGSQYARLSQEEYQACVEALLACPTARGVRGRASAGSRSHGIMAAPWPSRKTSPLSHSTSTER